MPVRKNRPVGLRYGVARHLRKKWRWWVCCGQECLARGVVSGGRKAARDAARAFIAEYEEREDRLLPVPSEGGKA